MTLTIDRDGGLETIKVTPREDGTIGINNFGLEYENAYKQVKYGFIES